MKKNALIVPLAFGLLVSMAACAQPADQAGDADALLGEWRMTSLESGSEGNLQSVPYTGQIVFTSGTVSVQAMNPDIDAPDTAYTVEGYEAFYGESTIDPDAGTFSVEVESALARDLIGETLTRNYEVTDDTLVLTPTDPAEGWRVTYERHSE